MAKKTTKKKASPKKPSRMQTVKTASKTVTSYKLLEEITVRGIEDQVIYYISKGWQPIGGVVLKGDKFIQTIVQVA